MTDPQLRSIINHMTTGSTTPRIPPPNINLHGKIPSNLPIATTLPTILPPKHLQHSPPPSQHRHAARKPRLIIQEMTNLNFQSPSLQVICSSISGMDPKQSGSGESDLDFATQIEWKRHRRFRMPSYSNQPRPSALKSSNEQWPLCNELIQKSPQRSPKKRSIWSPAPIYSPCLTWSDPSSSIYHRQICWLWFFHFLRSLASACHLHSKTPRIIPGTPSRHCHRNRSSHLAGRKDQTSQLVIQQKPQQMWYAHFWSFLSWQRNRQKRYLSRLGGKRTDGYHSKERERTTRSDRGGNVPRSMPSHCFQSWRQWNGTDLSCWQRGGYHLGKYTVAHSNHVGLKLIALKWQNLPTIVDDGDSSSDDYTYRGINERTKETHSGHRNEHHT